MGNGYLTLVGHASPVMTTLLQLTSGPPLRVCEHVNRETLKPELNSVAIRRESAR